MISKGQAMRQHWESTYFECPEHGDRAIYSPGDDEAYCIDHEDVLDLEHPAVLAAIATAR